MNKQRQQSSGANALMVISLTMLAKIIAIVRQMVLTYFYGAGSISDAYLLAQSIPNILFLLVSSAIGVSFTPVFMKVKEEKGDKESNRFTGNILSILIIISSIFVVFTLIFARSIVFIFANGFDESTASITATFLRISIFSIYFVGMVGVFSAYLKIKGDYFSPSIIGIALSFVEISSCIIAAKVNDIFLPVGILLATMTQWIIVVIASKKRGFHFYPHIDFKSKYIDRAIKISLPIMIGLGVDQINVIIDRTIASTFSSGSISSLTYANTIVTIVHTVIAVSINSIVFVEVTKHASAGKRELVVDEIFKGLEKALMLLVPAMVGLICFAQPIVKNLYERGNFDSTQTLITAEILVFYVIYIIPNGIRIIVQSYFYAYGRTKFCMYAGFVAVAVNIVFNLCLSRWMGVNGLAMATSLGIIVSTIIIFMRFLKENQGFPLGKFFVQFLKSCLCSAIMIVPVYLLFNMLIAYMPQIVALLIVVIVACIIYFSFAALFGVVNKDDIKSIAKKFLRR